MHPTEYAIILLTFGAINCFGLEVGMCGGVLIAMCHFIVDYASAPVVRRIDVPQCGNGEGWDRSISREGWENGTPPPHRDFKERGVVR